MQYIKLDDTVYFFFGVNNTSGTGEDGTSEAVFVRDTNDVIGAVPMALVDTPATVQLLTGAGFPDGCYQIAIAATTANLFAQDRTYAVFATIAIDAQNPTGHIGIFKIGSVPSNVTDMGANVVTKSAMADNAIDVAVIADATITAAKFAANAITAAVIATDAIDDDALAADAVTAIQLGLSTFDATTDLVTLASDGWDNVIVDGMAGNKMIAVIAAGTAGKLSDAGTGTETFVSVDGATTRFVSTVDGSGNRTGVTYP